MTKLQSASERVSKYYLGIPSIFYLAADLLSVTFLAINATTQSFGVTSLSILFGGLLLGSVPPLSLMLLKPKDSLNTYVKEFIIGAAIVTILAINTLESAFYQRSIVFAQLPSGYVTVALFAAGVSESFFFFHYLYRFLLWTLKFFSYSLMPTLTAIVVNALFATGFHYWVYGTQTGILSYVFASFAIMGGIHEYTRLLWITITIHSLVNLIPLLYALSILHVHGNLIPLLYALSILHVHGVLI